MRIVTFVLVCLFCGKAFGQAKDSIVIPANSLFRNLTIGDSVTFYQCHVEQAVQQLTTASGQTLTGKPQKYAITEKYVLIRSVSGYEVNYYSSSLTIFPNRKFSGLKAREMPYWEFKREKTLTLVPEDLKVFLALERKGREAIEYDYAITRYTTNQIIIRKKKDFKQLVIDGNYVISKLIHLSKN